MAFPRLLVMGHAGHGKDTVCEIICDRYGVTYITSSLFAAEEVVRPALFKYGVTYQSVEDCFADRKNYRSIWYDAIRDFNRPDATRLGRAIFSRHAIYCGIRNAVEFHVLRNTGAFDISIWVDASARLPMEPSSSISVEAWMADYVIDNNSSLVELELAVNQLCDHKINGQVRKLSQSILK
jgi:dephospho-CoA kinase